MVKENQKSDRIVFCGKVMESLPNRMFRVELEEGGQVVLGILSGKMRKYHIKVVLGDRVEIEMTPYDVSKGRIIKRL